MAKNYGLIFTFELSYCVPVKFVDSSHTSSTCPRYGSKLKSRNGQAECVCGLKADKQFVGTFNIFMRGVGVSLNGDKAYDMLPMKPGAEANASQVRREGRSMRKASHSQMFINTLDGQTS
ncbi:MAG TPA: hypothetical protein ENI59_00590 [Euryarchaeota archaeon]|nr:hypothetical protein [Euryarchaeota archaeon]